MMARLFDERVGYFTQSLTDYGTGEQQQMQKRFITRYRLEKKDPNAAISEPVKPITYYVDPATPKKWVPCIKEGDRVLAAGVRAGRVQERHRREGSAEQGGGSGLEHRGHPLLGHRLSAVDDRERGRTASARSAERRDHQRERAVLPQRHEPREELVLRPGEPERSARAAVAAARRLMCNLVKYVVAHEVGHTLGLPAQHEGELDLHDRAGARSEVGQGERPHADAHGLLALQLRRAARRQDRSEGPDPEDRPVRQVGDALGLRADSGREDAGGREADARQVGARAGREAVPALLDGRRGRHRSR